MIKFTSVLRLLYLVFLVDAQNTGTEATIDKTVSQCVNETECVVPSTTDSYINTTLQDVTTINKGSSTEKSLDFSKIADFTKVLNATASPTQQTNSTSNATNSAINVTSVANGTAKELVLRKNHGEICECDLTVSSCDINCCCDNDCKESDTTVFSTCTDHHPKVYDSRYCYDSNFIERNNTEYLFERLTSSLFCIVHDNLPPAYSASYVPEIPNRKVLNDVISGIERSRFKGQWDTAYAPHPFDPTKPYGDGDVIWKLHLTYVKPLELPQTGFTGLCSFKKSVKYLRNWQESCMQTDLTNDNPQLFPATFHNYTVIASPNLYNETRITSENQTCPKNVCLSIDIHYCQDSWSVCSNETTLNTSCSSNVCLNVVKAVRYVITHSGTDGINRINVYMKLDNVTEKFYQRFDVAYEWASVNREKVFALSGNPGYIWEKPIIIGTLKTNKTNDIEYSYVSVDRTNYFLTLPVSRRNGECNDEDRYAVAFGEDLKIRCRVSLEVNNFTAKSCEELQSKVFKALLENSLFNLTEANRFATYVSKFGRASTENNSDWVQIFLDRLPQNVVTGRAIGDQVRCSGLVTSLRFDIVHSLLTKPQTTDNRMILGVAITFSEEADVSWSRCSGSDCTDILTVDVVGYANFHDASEPSKYRFVEGPNLDINLPHDFFYPFMNSRCKSVKGSRLLVGFVHVAILIKVKFH